jgi:hypothetical protein
MSLSVETIPPRRRLDLAAIEASLRRVQRDFAEINGGLQSQRDHLDGNVVENLMAGYAYVDRLISTGVPLFAIGYSKEWLEINRRVLCGNNEASRREYARHLEATERRFYEEREGGIRDLIEWYETHRKETVWQRAAGVYIRILSKPQLFIEGNHRSGALIMSYLLASEGKPPFVLSPENAKAYFDPSTLITSTDKKSLGMLFRLPLIRRRFAAFLADQAWDDYLTG